MKRRFKTIACSLAIAGFISATTVAQSKDSTSVSSEAANAERDADSLVVTSDQLSAEDRAARRKARKANRNADPIEVELFQAIDDGQVEVKFVPKDATQANVIFKNKTDKPLAIKLPETFAAVPANRKVNGQFGGGLGGGGLGGGGLGGGGFGGQGGFGGGGFGGQGGFGGGGGQGVGGGFGGGGFGGGGFGGGGLGGGGLGGGGFGGGRGGFGGGGGLGGGAFRVNPDNVRKMKVATVCLEHGKPDPRPKMEYEIVKLEEFTDDPKVAAICSLLGNGQVPQNTAQAVAWNVANGISWEELAHKPRVISRYTGIELFFNEFEIRNAFQLTAAIVEHVEAQSNSSNYDVESGSRYGQ